MKVVNEILDKYCHQLKGIEHLDVDGFVNIHANSRKAQATSITCINTLRRLGFKFDIKLYDGTIIHHVDINEAKVKVEYNIPPAVDTLAPNCLVAWRPSTVDLLPRQPMPGTEGWKVEKSGVLSIADQLLQQSFETVGVRVAHYANDKYKREIKPGVWIDVYDIIECYKPNNAALEHALKKILAAGKRGHKDFEQDLIDILSSVERALFQHQEKNK